jgi:hypothetical protein
MESSHRVHKVPAEEMTTMYNAMDEDLMFQDMRERADAMRAARAGSSDRESRRWWRRSAQRLAR